MTTEICQEKRKLSADKSAHREVDETAENETDDGEDDIVSANPLEEPVGGSNGGAREGVKESADHHSRSSGTPAAIGDSDEEGTNSQSRCSSYDSDISDVIVVDPGAFYTGAPHPVSKKKAQ